MRSAPGSYVSRSCSQSLSAVQTILPPRASLIHNTTTSELTESIEKVFVTFSLFRRSQAGETFEPQLSTRHNTSEASWETMSVRESGSTNKVRITVNFACGRSLLFPILPSALVSELKSEALRRAQASGLEMPAGESLVPLIKRYEQELLLD